MKEVKMLSAATVVLVVIVGTILTSSVVGRLQPILDVSWSNLTSDHGMAQALSAAPTREDLIARINELIMILYALIYRQQSCIDIPINLSPGTNDSATNGQVSKLQQFLVSTGNLASSAVSGTYDTNTVSAVKTFQVQQGILAPDTVSVGFGTVGPRTRAVIRTVSCAMRPKVRSGFVNHREVPTIPPLGLGICADGSDNDGDDLVDWPVDPGCSSVSDQDESNGSSEMFYVMSWEPSAYEASEHIIPVYWIGRSSTGGFVPPNPVEAAQEMIRRENLGIPKVMQDWDGDEYEFGLFDLLGTANDEDNCTTSSGEEFICLWWDQSVKNTQARYESFFTTFVANGGTVDFVFFDFEKGFSNWTIGSSWPNDAIARRWTAIQNDSRFASEGLASELGFSDLTTVHDWSHNGNHYVIWNSVMSERMARYLNEATYDVITSFFPNIKVANYGSMAIAERYSLRDYNGHDISLRNQYDSVVGTHQQPVLFGSLGQISQVRIDGTNLYTATAFNAFRLDQNTLRVAKFSDQNAPLIPAIGYKGHTGLDSRYANSDFYQETIIHALLAGSEFLYYWNPYSSWLLSGQYRDNRQIEDKLVDDTVNEFQEIANFSDKASLLHDDNDANQYEINELIDWGADYVLTGVVSGGRRVWRFTSNDAESIPPINRLVTVPGETGIHLQTNRGVLSFPEGVVWTPTSPDTVAPNGIWIVQPVSATASF